MMGSKLKRRLKFVFTFLTLVITLSFTSSPTYSIAVLKYKGGGDWYANPTALGNLINFCNDQLGTNIKKEPGTVDVGSAEIFNYPFVHMTGHGNVVFSAADLDNLRKYLLSGGFLHIDDNYGMDQFIRPQLKKLFPEYDLVPIPPTHPIFHQKFEFSKGLPKIHEHDNKEPLGYGIFHEGRMLVFYSYECDLGDGWEDPEVHNDSPEKRLEALKMGANIIQYVFTSQTEKQ